MKTMDESAIRQAVSSKARNEFQRRWKAYHEEVQAALGRMISGLEYSAVEQVRTALKAKELYASSAIEACPLAMRDLENGIVLDLVSKVALVEQLLAVRDEYQQEQAP